MTLRVDWRTVLNSRWRGLRLISAQELLSHRRTAAEIEQGEKEETSFRRGFQDGYSRAMDDMLAVSSREYSRVRECFNWLAVFHDGVLNGWRYEWHPTYKPPPDMPLPPKWSEQRAMVRRRDSGCVSCGAVAGLECDHVLPVAQGGMAELENLRMLCASCHLDRKRG